MDTRFKKFADIKYDTFRWTTDFKIQFVMIFIEVMYSAPNWILFQVSKGLKLSFFPTINVMTWLAKWSRHWSGVPKVTGSNPAAGEKISKFLAVRLSSRQHLFFYFHYFILHTQWSNRGLEYRSLQNYFFLFFLFSIFHF